MFIHASEDNNPLAQYFRLLNFHRKVLLQKSDII